MQKGFAPILVLVGILIIAAIVGVAYYFGKSQISKLQNSVVVSSTPQLTAVSSSSPDASPVPNGIGGTANWKTYTNDKYDISFKYPADWNSLATDDPAYVLFKPQDFPSQTESQIPGISVSLMREDYDSAVQRLVAAYGSKNKANITFNGIKFVHIWGTINEGPAQGLAGGGYIFDNNGKAIEVGYEVVHGRNYNQEAKQILSTFKFTQ